jgi:hypothetical protein
MGGEVHLFQPWSIVESIKKDGKWNVDELTEAAVPFYERQFDHRHTLGGRV